MPSRDFERTIAFCERRGFTLADRYDDNLVPRRDGIELHFFAGWPCRERDRLPWRGAFEVAGSAGGRSAADYGCGRHVAPIRRARRG